MFTAEPLPEPMLTYVTHHNYITNCNALRYEVAAIYPRQIRWLSAILQYFHYVSSGDTAVLHQAMEYYDILHRFQQYHCHSPCKLSKRFENWNGWSGRARFIKAFFVTARWRNEMKHVARYWPFVRGIHRLLVDSLHKGQWSEASIFNLWSAPEQAVEQTMDTPDVWDAIALIMTSL